MLRILSIAVLAALATGLPCAAQAVAQLSQDEATPLAREIALDLSNVSVAQALSTISKSANVTLHYSSALLPHNTGITIRNSHITVANALKQALQGTGFEYKLNAEGRISIVPVQKSTKAQGTITGKVLDAKTGKGIADATVSLNAETRGVTTAEDGSYRITGVGSGTHTVVVRLVGYAKQTRSVTLGEGAIVTLDFKMEPSANVLSQVIVTGTIVQTELKAVSSAITIITAKQIEERGITRIDQLFRGDVPGLFAMNLGSQSGLDEVTMFSRGATAISDVSAGATSTDGNVVFTNPIKTYVDGVEMADPRFLSQIDPSSIERIEILTGPQASTIYGSNALNGVMQIFTKRGSALAPQVMFNAGSGVVQSSFSNRLAPSHLTDMAVSGVEGQLSYNVGGSWNYIGSWTPGKRTQRLSAYGGIRRDAGKLTIDLSARHGLTINKSNGHQSQAITQLRASGLYSYSAINFRSTPINEKLKGRTFGVLFVTVL